MPDEKRRVLTEDEKLLLLEKHKDCYICLESLANYDRKEIQFDHIYNFADGYPQELSNFAPVHASDDLRKRNCHKAKGRKSPFEYREEMRIESALKKVSGFGDLCPNAVSSIHEMSEDKTRITFNGIDLPLYNQLIDGKDHYYFFHEVETKYLENDEEIQLRPLEPKILPLIFNLKHAVQLLPSLGRLDPNTNTVKLFDGQHKAVAQIIGNNRKDLPCIIFVHPDIDELRVVIYQAHTDFVQQRYKKSHIDSKLAAIYNQKIEAFRRQVGDPNATYSEAVILRGEGKPAIKQFLMSSIIDEVKDKRTFIDSYGAEDRAAQKQKPVLWQSIERAVRLLCNLEPVEKPSDDSGNYRADEVENLCFILDQIEAASIKGKWDPKNPESKAHQLARTYYYRTAFNNWIEILEEALRFSLEQMKGARIYEAICYREEFSPEIKKRIVQIIQKLFEHPLWVQERVQNDIAVANNDATVRDVFRAEGLDYIYLTKL
jgi:hypothetical protein